MFIADGLHRALQTAHNAQRATDLLLQEMSHRVKNKFAMVSSIISLQARRSSPEVRTALEDVASRVSVIANVHNFLQLSRHDGQIKSPQPWSFVRSYCPSGNDRTCTPQCPFDRQMRVRSEQQGPVRTEQLA